MTKPRWDANAAGPDLQPCLECGRTMRPANLRRHVGSGPCRLRAAQRAIRARGLTRAGGMGPVLRSLGVSVEQGPVNHLGRDLPLVDGPWAPPDLVAAVQLVYRTFTSPAARHRIARRVIDSAGDRAALLSVGALGDREAVVHLCNQWAMPVARLRRSPAVAAAQGALP